MGGDTLRCFASEDESSLDNECHDFHVHSPALHRGDNQSVSGFSEMYGEMGHWMETQPVEFDGNLRRRKNAYREIMKNYDDLWVRRETLHQAKSKILNYTPGSWINNVGKKQSNQVTPKTTTLLLIGPNGSGKSSLVNRVSRVLEDDKFASERAQVTYNPSSGEGTYFLQEYMIPRNSTSFCLFDTRSLSENFTENDEILRNWMTRGVRHGELVVRDSDSPSLKMALKCKARQSGSPSSEIRKVNFVIFVVNGFSVLKAMNGNKEERRYMEMVEETYKCAFLSFKDDKPVIVVTHGDLLSVGDRARVRIFLGEKLGVPPAKQIFDIPDNSDPSTELTILDMVKYSLEHADKNFPCRESREWMNRRILPEDGANYKIFRTSLITSIFLALLLGIACVTFPMLRSHKHDELILTSSINRHSKSEANQRYQPRKPPTEVNHEADYRVSGTHQPGYKQVSGNHEADYRLPGDHQPQRESGNHQPDYKQVSGNHQPGYQASETRPDYQISANHQHGFQVSADRQPDYRVSVHNQHDYQVSDKQEPQGTPTPSKPMNPNAATSASTSSSKPIIHGPCEQRESRSPSLETRHPKSAVKWHKIRHLYLDSD